MEVPETIPIAITPETQKTLTPAAVKRADPPFHDPERESGRDGSRSKRRRKPPCDHDGETEELEASQYESSKATRGSRIDVRA